MSSSRGSAPIYTAALSASLLLVLGGCQSTASSQTAPRDSTAAVVTTSGAVNTPTPSTSTLSPATAIPAASDGPAASAPDPGATAEVSTTAGSTTAALITGIRSATHPGYDRVVIDLSGPMPGYQVSYVSGLVFDASGATVPLNGPVFLRIRLTPAAAHDAATGKPYFPDGAVTHVRLPTLSGYAQTGDFEGVVSFGLELSHKAGFHVFTLTGPSRIVVDIANTSSN